jgi:tripartite-type tricarboxylate transporter receptor subunit TctC
MMIVSRSATFAWVVLLAVSMPAALAQNFPVKPVRIVIGPGSDLLPRLVGQKLAGAWGQQVIVDPHPGGGGIIALDFTAKSAADGHTWLISTISNAININFYPNQPNNLVKDFESVVLMTTGTFFFLVTPSLPAKSVSELVQLARAKPGQLNFGSSGNGTSTHLAGEMLKYAAGINIVHVPYKTADAAVMDVIGGQVHITFQFAPFALPHVKSGKLRALAVTSPKRALIAPEVPTVAESGFAGFEMVAWTGVHVPAGTPKPIVAKINKDILVVLNLPDVQERLAGAGLEPAGNTPEEFAAFVRKDIAHWAKVIEQTGVKPE